MEQLTLPYQFIDPPKRLKEARMDNIVIIPGNLWMQEAKYEECKRRANSLPSGSVLILSPAKERLAKILESAASFFKGHGHPVITIPAV